MIGMMELATHADATFWVVVREFVVEMSVGLAIGVAGAFLVLQSIRRVDLPNPALYPLRTLAAAGVIYGVAAIAHGSGFLAVFVAGIIIGDADYPRRDDVERFHTSLASLAEVVVFVALGLTVNKVDLESVWKDALLIGSARLPSAARSGRAVPRALRLRRGERLFVMWSGLKGAVPILLAAFALLEHVAGAERIYGIVFVRRRVLGDRPGRHGAVRGRAARDPDAPRHGGACDRRAPRSRRVLRGRRGARARRSCGRSRSSSAATRTAAAWSRRRTTWRAGSGSTRRCRVPRRCGAARRRSSCSRGKRSTREYSRAVWTAVREVVPTVERTGHRRGLPGRGGGRRRLRPCAGGRGGGSGGGARRDQPLVLARSRELQGGLEDRERPPQAGRPDGRARGREAVFLAPFDVRRLPGRRPAGGGAAAPRRGRDDRRPRRARGREAARGCSRASSGRCCATARAGSTRAALELSRRRSRSAPRRPSRATWPRSSGCRRSCAA